MDAPVIQIVGSTVAVHVGTAIRRTWSGDCGTTIDAIVDAIDVLVDSVGGTAGRATVTRLPGAGVEAIRDAVLVKVGTAMEGQVGIEGVNLVGFKQLLGPTNVKVERDTGLEGASAYKRG